MMAPVVLMTDLEMLEVKALTMLLKMQVLPIVMLKSVHLAQELYFDLAGHVRFLGFVLEQHAIEVSVETQKLCRNKLTALSVFATLAIAAVASPSSSAMGAFLMSTLN
jgi:hypothetical protein